MNKDLATMVLAGCNTNSRSPPKSLYVKGLQTAFHKPFQDDLESLVALKAPLCFERLLATMKRLLKVWARASLRFDPYLDPIDFFGEGGSEVMYVEGCAKRSMSDAEEEEESETQ